ncbi:cytochrome P450 [Mycobacterium montefiorense]|uniref:cytochrome P450 n=2 Tax=Mycobacterium montefiorense TaxID=154654 RepID=UPI0021F2CF53|nr:cytochrome P450 [Mycobacterium montefiorense]
MGMAVSVKDRMHWLTGAGVTRLAVKLAARQGDPVLQLFVDERRKNVYELVDDIRTRGRIVRFAGGGLITADMRIIREIFRDDRFRTIKPQDQAPFRLVRWILDKTDPNVLDATKPPSMLMSDPPEHARLRRLVSQAFTPRAIQRLRSRIQTIANGLLDDLEDAAECDLVAGYTSRLPIEAIAEVLGIPREETSHLDAVSEHATRLLSGAAPAWRDFQAAINTAREFEPYLAMHIEQLRQRGNDDSIMAGIVRAGDLSERDVRVFVMLLLAAGIVTTTNVMGNGVSILLRHPDQLASLQAHPEGWPNAVEEVLRYETSIPLGVRVATETLELGGQNFRPGQAILFLLGGANRDPAVFERPGEFDITRANAREHISFGSGIHACLGAALARMELDIGLQSLFARFPDLALAGDPALNASMALNGLKNLPVRLRPSPLLSR